MIVARLYRGPAAGKRIALSKDLNVVRLPGFKKSRGLDPFEMVTYNYRRTNHTHPDGSVYYEWDQPKGTKIK